MFGTVHVQMFALVPTTTASVDYFLADAGQDFCPRGSTGVAKAQCIVAALAAGREVGRSGSSRLGLGTWAHTPPGCFVDVPKHPLVPHFSSGTGRHGEGGYPNEEYQLACERPKKGTCVFASLFCVFIFSYTHTYTHTHTHISEARKTSGLARPHESKCRSKVCILYIEQQGVRLRKVTTHELTRKLKSDLVELVFVIFVM